MREIFSLTILLLLSLTACKPMERAEVMSEVTFEIEYPAGIEPAELSYQLKYDNHNTRVTTTRNSITTPTYQDELLRGLYTVHVEGTCLLPSGEIIRIRGVENDQLFLARQERCLIKLIQMP